MNPETLVVYIKLQELITIREGMIAANTKRTEPWQALAYDDAAFQSLSEQMAKLLEESF